MCPLWLKDYNSYICGTFQVFSYVLIAALTSYIKLSIVVQLHCNEENDVTLFMAGMVTQIGSLCGAVLFFALVYYTRVYTCNLCRNEV